MKLLLRKLTDALNRRDATLEYAELAGEKVPMEIDEPRRVWREHWENIRLFVNEYGGLDYLPALIPSDV